MDTIFQFKEIQLADLLKKATEAGVSKMLTELGLKKCQLSQRESIKKYGHARVMRWRKEGKITPIKSGRTVYYKVEELERLHKVNEFYTKDWEKAKSEVPVKA